MKMGIGKKLSMIAVLGIGMFALIAASAPVAVATPPTPFMVYGYVFYENGTACKGGPVVNITNLNTTKQWTAETNANYNYYQLILANGTDLNASEILHFNVSDGIRHNTTNYTVTQTDFNDGGLFNFNLTLPAVPEPQNTFICWGPEGNFGSMAIEEHREIPSFGLNNTGSMNATVEAKFISKNATGVYGLVNSTTGYAIPGTAFGLKAVDLGGSETWLREDGNNTIIPPEIPPGSVCYDYNASLIVPPHTPPGIYKGTIQLTFSAT